MKFGEVLRTIRSNALLSQSELAIKAGVPVGTLRHHERGHRLPSFGHAIRYAIALNVSLDEFRECEDLLGDCPPADPPEKPPGRVDRLKAIEDKIRTLEDRIDGGK